MEKKKICCFCQRWASGGIESFLFNLARQPRLQQVQLHIVAAKLEPSHQRTQLEAQGVRFIELSGSLHRPVANARLFRRLLRQENYHGVHLNLYQGLSLYYARIAEQEGVRIRIAHSHNEALRKSGTRWAKLWLHRIGRRCFTRHATHLWACSKAAGEFLFHEKARPVCLIPNGIDADRFRFRQDIRQQIRGEMGVEDTLVLGNVGRLCSQKNQSFLLEIFAQLVKIHPNSRLLLVGDGEDRHRLEKQAAALGVDEKVIFCGRAENVPQLLWAMDVFAMPSLFEGLPLAVVEAQAAGLPVLCSRGLSPEMKLTQNLEFLPLEAGAMAWARSIWKLARSPMDRSAGAEQVAKAGFDVHAVAGTVLDTYLERTDDEAHRFGDRADL